MRHRRKKNKKLQVNCAGISDVESGMRLVLFFVCKEKELVSWKQLHVGSIDGISCQRTPSSDDDTAVAEPLGAGGQEDNDEARHREETHEVPGQHGHQDGV